MAVQLTPRNYKPGLSWKLLTKNKVDTVASEPYTNARIEGQLIHSESITSAQVFQSGSGNVNVQLPAAASYIRTNEQWETNDFTMPSSSIVRRASGRVQILRGSGSFTLRTEIPLTELPTVKLSFEGITSCIDRGSKTCAQMSQLFDQSINTNIASVVYNNRSRTEEWQNSKSVDTYNRGALADATLVDYTKEDVPLYPFVKVVRRADTGTEADWNANKLSEEEVLTHWISATGYSSRLIDWSAYYDDRAFFTWDSRVNTDSATIALAIQRAAFKEDSVGISAYVTRIDDYTYNVEWSAPIYYAYSAWAQAFLSSAATGNYDVDSYAFLDQITKITADVYVTTLDHDTTVPRSYSLINNALTTNVVNEYPVSFDKNEFITLATYENSPSNLWTESMALRILQAYKDGKYVVECEVNAQWALSNNISINSEIQVTLQNGTKITRGNNTVTFEVKTIEKIFKCSEFTYALRLLEK